MLGCPGSEEPHMTLYIPKSTEKQNEDTDSKSNIMILRLVSLSSVYTNTWPLEAQHGHHWELFRVTASLARSYLHKLMSVKRCSDHAKSTYVLKCDTLHR